MKDLWTAFLACNCHFLPLILNLFHLFSAIYMCPIYLSTKLNGSLCFYQPRSGMVRGWVGVLSSGRLAFWVHGRPPQPQKLDFGRYFDIFVIFWNFRNFQKFKKFRKFFKKISEIWKNYILFSLNSIIFVPPSFNLTSGPRIKILKV